MPIEEADQLPTGWTVTLNPRAPGKSNGAMAATASYVDENGRIACRHTGSIHTDATSINAFVNEAKSVKEAEESVASVVEAIRAGIETELNT